MIKIFKNLMQTINPQIQEFQLTLNSRNIKKIMPRYNISKWLKISGNKRNLKSQREKKDILHAEGQRKGSQQISHLKTM